MPDSSASDNLLLDTIVRIRIATKLITPMLTELPGEVRRLMGELGESKERADEYSRQIWTLRDNCLKLLERATRAEGIMQNDILSALDDCVDLGMDAKSVRDVIKAIVAKALKA